MKVLTVDDETVRRIIKNIAASPMIDVYEYEGGTEALRIRDEQN